MRALEPENDSCSGSLRTLRITASVTVLMLAYQFVTAGQMLSRSPAAHELHSEGAIVLHIVAGLTALAAAAHWRLHHGRAWPVVLTTGVFALSFAQAYVGDQETLWLHVPGALVLTVGSVWTAAWSFNANTPPTYTS